MKNKLGIIIGICLLAGGVIAATSLYTTEEIDDLLDEVNARISTSSGASDAGKMVKTNASGVLDGTLVGTLSAGSITVDMLDIANSETDEYALTYEADTANFQWVAIPGGGDITTVGLCLTGDCTDDFINGTDIVDDAINSEHYATASIDTLHLSNDIITGAKIADDAVDSEHYAAGSIDAEHLSADIIDETKLADDSIDSEHYNDGSIDAAHLAADIIDETKLADDSIDSEHYNDGSIDAAHLAADIIDETKIADDGIDSEHYNDASIDPAHLNFVVAPAAGSDEYAVTYEHSTGNFELVAIPGGGDITTVGTCLTGDCTDDFINGTDIADDAIDSEHYAAGSIDLEHMSANSVDSDQYVDGSIDLIHMSVNSVDSDQYVDGSIDLIHMSVNSVDSDQYVDGSIDLIHMSVNSVDSDQYVNASIDPEHLNFVVAPGAGNDEYAVTYENATGQFELVAMTTGGTMSTVEEGDSQVGDQDIVTLDFNSGAFATSEAPNTEVNISARRHKCAYIEDLTSADKNVMMGSLPVAITVIKVWCQFHGTGTTPAIISLEDAGGTAMVTSAALTCQDDDDPISEGTGLETIDSGGGLIAYETLMFDVDNTPEPTTDDYQICVEYTID